MRVLFLIRSLGLGGAERQLSVLAKALSARGHAVSVAVFYPGGAIEQELVDAGIPLQFLGKRGRWDLGGPLRRFIELIRCERPDIVHAYLPPANILATVARFFVRRPRLVFGLRASNVEAGPYGVFSRLTYRVEAWLARYADLVIANSAAGLQSALARGLPTDRGLVIPNGIDTERFCPDRKASTRIGAFRVGMIARLDPMKDHATFFAAARLVVAKRKDVVFVLAGEGTEALVDRAEGLPLEIAGALAKPEALIASLDVAVMSSRFGEGFPNAVAEAMACGVPVVATDVGDARNIVGDVGRIVPPGMPLALADAMFELMAVARDEALRSACRKKVETRFSVANLAERTEAAFASLEARSRL